MSDKIVLFVASFFSVWIKFMTLNTKFIYATGRANLARPVAYKFLGPSFKWFERQFLRGVDRGEDSQNPVFLMGF